MQSVFEKIELSPAAMEFLSSGNLPDATWSNQDDLCDCIYQRTGSWTNPYIGVTEEIRLCCVWAELRAMWPQHFRTTNAYRNGNTGEWETGAAKWDGNFDMPLAIWHRQLATKFNCTIEEARAMNLPAPQAVERKPEVPFILVMGGTEWVLDLASRR